ncbi:MAG: GNAT family N-acetyltransferase [Clostridia bacterium]|nr:GNAT family N-acetyltransferase [Clostridia bacterium]
MKVTIRRAEFEDIGAINDLLFQVAQIHAAARPDIFKGGTKKHTDDELKAIILDDETPIYVALDGNARVVGYAFCIYKRIKDSNLLCDSDTLYIDDLCVDESARGQHVGKALYEYVTAVARDTGCSRVTLNVWAFNESAARFYEKCGMKPLKTEMEYIL